jgi:hypothetical protein
MILEEKNFVEHKFFVLDVSKRLKIHRDTAINVDLF